MTEPISDTVTTRDGTRIHFEDGGSGRPVVFSHGWPLHSGAWDAQRFSLAASGFRCIAHDRRGHGLSSRPWEGHDLDHYADDLADLIEALDLRDVVLVGHSTGGGEVTRYVGRHGTSRVAGVVLVSAIPPLMLRTDDNPEGTPLEVFDELRARSIVDRSQLYLDLASGPFYGGNRAGARISEGIVRAFWLQGMMASQKAAYDCIRAFSETDLTEDLRRIDVPTLILHGDDDQIVPIQASAMRSSRLVPGAKLKVYPGAPHGLPTTHADAVSQDLLEFVRGLARKTERAAPEARA